MVGAVEQIDLHLHHKPLLSAIYLVLVIGVHTASTVM